MSRRGNGEGSIYPRKSGGFAAYVWVTTPDGTRRRKYVYGKTREEVKDKWLKLHEQARKGPVATTTPTVAAYLSAWLGEVVAPNLSPKTYEKYEMCARLYIAPGLGGKRLDRLTVRDVRTWLNRLRETCQCCAQGKDARRPEDKRRCCAVGTCCKQYPSGHVIHAAREVLRTALSNAVTEELISKNVAGLVKLSSPGKRKRAPWSVEEVRRFLESARRDHDPLYAAYVLILVLGLRKGEVLGLTWDDVDLDAGELYVNRQLQRVGGRLHLRETKTDASTALLPLPAICVAALRLRDKEQTAQRDDAGDGWDDSRLVFTTRHGTPIEPRNFNRSFATRCRKADVPPLRVHDTRHTCASLLAALDVHPRIAMQILRHSRVAVTLDIYTAVYPKGTQDALKRLGESLDVDGAEE